jgi:hypothetical protein
MMGGEVMNNVNDSISIPSRRRRELAVPLITNRVEMIRGTMQRGQSEQLV